MPVSPSPCSPPRLTKHLTRVNLLTTSFSALPLPRPNSSPPAPAPASGPPSASAADPESPLAAHTSSNPPSPHDPRHMLEKLSARTHSVFTGVALIRLPDAERRTFVETTHVHFAKLDNEEITRYLSTGEPHDKAGAYAIQGRAGRFIPRIEGCYFNVVGLPPPRPQQTLVDLGWSED